MIDVIEIYRKDLPRNGHLTTAESVRLGKLAASGDQQARDIMIKSCLKLVYAVAKRHWRMFHEKNHLTLGDLVQDGNIGLLEAVKHYDYHKEIKFSFYAFFWIKAEIMCQLNSYLRPFRLPENIINDGLTYKKLADKLRLGFGREPTLMELSEATHCPPERLRQTLLLCNYRKVYMNDLLDSTGNRGDLTYEDVLEDMEAVNWLDREETLSSRLRACFKFLKPREREIIVKLFGIDCDPLPMSRLAENLSISLERVRQIKNHGLKTLAERLLKPSVLN